MLSKTETAASFVVPVDDPAMGGLGKIKLPNYAIRAFYPTDTLSSQSRSEKGLQKTQLFWHIELTHHSQ